MLMKKEKMVRVCVLNQVVSSFFLLMPSIQLIFKSVEAEQSSGDSVFRVQSLGAY